MKTLFDTSVILDARDPSSAWHAWAVNELANAVGAGGAVVNSVVLAEASVRAPDKVAVRGELESWGIELVDLPQEAAEPTAAAFATYLDRLKREGKTRPRTPLPDFFIGGHAAVSGYPLATRDSARIKTYFPRVPIIEPAA